MDNRERIIRLWFDMWLAKKDLGIFNVFSDNAVYIESWGPEYHGSKKIKLWFEEWNTRGTVLQFGCNENRYDPYKDGNIPHFRDENAKWF